MLDNTVVDTEWTSDTGASNHLTSKPGMLTDVRKYFGTNSVVTGNGSSSTDCCYWRFIY
jgi:hypothetical protein